MGRGIFFINGNSDALCSKQFFLSGGRPPLLLYLKT